jgi:hypothetical protein
MTIEDGAAAATRSQRSVAGLTRVLTLVLALGPALAAVWWHHGFVTQDGPAHLYNAHVLARSFDESSPFRAYFEVRTEPLPNWAGHLVLAFLVAALSPRDADRAMTTLTLVAFAASVVLLRQRVRGREESAASAASGSFLAVLLALNVTWLLGFSSFLLGACLFPMTLAAWWSGRLGGWSSGRALRIAVLIVLGYFCHLVSLGLTAVGLVVLEALTPCPDRGRRRGRLATTAAGLLPLLPLAAVYLVLVRRGGGIAPEWKHLQGIFSVRAWVAQLTWVDPVSLARKDYLPIAASVARWHIAFAPVLWLGAALALAIAASFRDHDRRGWWVLSALLLLGGLGGPDTLGASHGEYLQQRVVLLGLVALVPVVRLGDGRLGGASAVALGIALALQLATVWDYAVASDRTAGKLLAASPYVGTGQRVATRMTGIPTPFRANPLLHADCALGVGNGNIIWGDYETRLYYFPVKFREGLDRPDPWDLERLALDDDTTAEGRDRRARLWTTLLEQHGRSIDVVLAWGDDPLLDAVTARWYIPDPGLAEGPVRVFRRQPHDD